MAATAAYTGALSVSTDDSTYNAVTGGKSVGAPFQADSLDTSYIGGGQWKTTIQGLKSAQWSIEADLVTETAQTALRTAFTSGATVYVKHLWDGTNGWKQAVKVMSFDVGASVDGLVTVTYNLESQAAPTFLP